MKLTRRVCASLLICVCIAQGAVFNIPNGDIAALKDAITAANSNGQADVINLAANGTYTLAAIDNSLSVNCDGLTTAKGTLSGAFPGDRSAGIYLWQATLALTNCTVRNHTAKEGAGYASQSTLTLNNSFVSVKASDYGGGVSNLEGTVTATGSTFSDNSADERRDDRRRAVRSIHPVAFRGGSKSFARLVGLPAAFRFSR